MGSNPIGGFVLLPKSADNIGSCRLFESVSQYLIHAHMGITDGICVYGNLVDDVHITIPCLTYGSGLLVENGLLAAIEEMIRRLLEEKN